MNAHILIVEAPYYQEISDQLAAGAIAEIERQGATFERVTVPGALEIPQAMAFGLATGAFDGAVALGCVIRGETSHYDIVANESARGLMHVALMHGAPVGNGILTVDEWDQAMVRARVGDGNKGGAAAAACLEALRVKRVFAGRGDE